MSRFEEVSAQLVAAYNNSVDMDSFLVEVSKLKQAEVTMTLLINFWLMQDAGRKINQFISTIKEEM